MSFRAAEWLAKVTYIIYNKSRIQAQAVGNLAVKFLLISGVLHSCPLSGSSSIEKNFKKYLGAEATALNVGLVIENEELKRGDIKDDIKGLTQVVRWWCHSLKLRALKVDQILVRARMSEVNKAVY